MLPFEFTERVRNILKDEYEGFIKCYELNNHRALRVNTLKGSIDYFLEKNPWGISQKDAVDWCKNGFYFTADDVGTHPYHAAGVYYIQEPSAMLPVQELCVSEGERILDMCASPGGKSTQIAEKLGNSGLLVCNEIDAKRAGNLSENIERMGICNALVINHTPDAVAERFPGYFDRVLVDSPCSGEGMFRKNPEAVKEWSMENVKMCAKRSLDILNCANKVLKSNGRLVYSTCTFAPEEDEECINAFLSEHPGYEIIGMKKLWPHKVRGEGHFCAVLEKGQDTENGRTKIPVIKGLFSKDVKELKTFESENLRIKTDEIFADAAVSYIRFGAELYAVREDHPDIKGLRVLRPGLHLGTLKKDRMEPAFALSHFLGTDDVVSVTDIDITRALEYIKGMTFPANGKKGYHLITVDGYSLCWGKLSDGIMKNHYPKGLRR